MFFLPVDQLEKLVKSSPRLAENPEGIQRLLSQKRLREIADYISRPETCFPNNIIVSLTKDVKFERTSPTGMGNLVFPSDEGHFGDIIDGQHRLYGIVHEQSREKSLPMPVTGLMLKDARSAARIFADINHLQKSISNLLIVTLQRELGDLVDAKDSAAAMVEQLNQHEDSPLRGKMKNDLAPFQRTVFVS